MTGTHSIEPMLEQLYSSVLDPAGLHTFVGNLDDGTDFANGRPQFERRRHSPPIRHDPPGYSAAMDLSTERRHAVSNGTGVVRLLQPHLHTAYAIQRRLNRLEAQLHTLHGLLDRLAAGVVMLDAQGHCLFANPAAQLLLTGHDGMQLVHGRLRACIATDQLRLRALIDLAVSSLAAFDAQMLLRDLDGRPALILTISTLHDPAAGEDGDRTRAVVFVQPVIPNPGNADAALRELFGFTSAEARLALALFDTGDLAEACERLGKSLATGRVQLRMLMEKTGCHRQSALFRVLSVALSLPGACSSQRHPPTSFG
jgi:PAS domain-containing protein